MERVRNPHVRENWRECITIYIWRIEKQNVASRDASGPGWIVRMRSRRPDLQEMLLLDFGLNGLGEPDKKWPQS